MKLTPDDPLLTAYALGELVAAEAASVEREIANDPALQLEIQRIQKFEQVLIHLARITPQTLLPEQQREILETAWQADQPTIKPLFSSITETLKTWFIPASAAAILTLATLILMRIPDDKPVIASRKSAIAEKPLTEIAKTTSEPILARMAPRSSGNTTDYPTLRLPIQIADSSFEQISKTIRDERKLPTRDAVKAEEILNHFPLRLNGITAIARSGTNPWHPDNRESGMTRYLATLTTEMMSCPWKPSATLLLISLRGNSQADCEVKLTFHANAKNISRYKLLGFTSNNGQLTENLAVKLPAKSSTILAIEIEPSRVSSDFGSLQWITDDKAAPEVLLVRKTDAEPSDDARFAALVCTYSQWLTGEQAGIIQPEMVSSLAREITTNDLPEDRADFLKLVTQSLGL
jgi:hypothetical protein